MSELGRLAQVLSTAASMERHHDQLGIYWRNFPIAGSYARTQQGRVADEEVERRKKALRKSWPELARMLDAISDNLPYSV